MEFGFELQTEGASTMDITTIGFDLAKTVFQVHGADGEGRPGWCHVWTPPVLQGKN